MPASAHQKSHRETVALVVAMVEFKKKVHSNRGWEIRFPQRRMKLKQKTPKRETVWPAIQHKELRQIEIAEVNRETMEPFHPLFSRVKIISRDAKAAAWQLMYIEQTETDQGWEWTTAGNFQDWSREIARLEAPGLATAKMNYLLERQGERIAGTEQEWMLMDLFDGIVAQ